MHMQMMRQSYSVYMWSVWSKHNKTMSWLWAVKTDKRSVSH